MWDGGSDNAVADFEKAMRFSPRGPWAYNAMIGMAQGHNAGRYIDAAKCADKFVADFPYFIARLRGAILCYVGAGRLDDAKKALREILRLSPKSRLSTMPPGGFRSPELISKVRAALLAAGLPDDQRRACQLPCRPPWRARLTAYLFRLSARRVWATRTAHNNILGGDRF
jgi:tetratricopeptide (TPR) repeat protein